MFGVTRELEYTRTVIDDRCPARFVNDSRGISPRPNIHFMQHPDVRELLDKERLHLLLHAKVVLGIGAGEQLLCNYSDGYWQKSGGGLAQSVPEEEEKKVIKSFSSSAMSPPFSIALPPLSSLFSLLLFLTYP